ncbi:MAG: MATE family efflux transporter [Sphingobacteriia bacterium]|nr:MATE family efflux transporter [Sphingobacteriia bacterium]
MKNLTEGKEMGLITSFALPMILGNVFMQAYSVVDSIILGNYVGNTALAAVGASFPFIFALVSFVIGLGMGFSISISQYFGARDLDKVKKAIDTLWIFLSVSTVLTTIIGLLISEWAMKLIGVPAEVLPEAVIYLNISIIGFVAMFGFNGLTSVLRGLGDSKTPLYFLIFSTVINAGLNLLFVIVFKWGVAGSAWATAISQALGFIGMVIYLNPRNELVKLTWRKYVFDKEIFRSSVKIGVPTALQQTFVSLGMMALMSIVSRFGTQVVAAYTVATRIDSFASMPAMNFAAALSTFTGQNLGAGKPERVRKGLTVTLGMTSLISLFVTLIAHFYSKELMSLFTTDPEVIRYGSDYLIIVCSFYILFSAMFSISGVMRGAGDTLVPMLVTLFSLWLIRIPLAHFLSGSLGVHGIWWAIPVAWAIGLAGAWVYYKTGRWKTKVLVKR